MQTLTPDQHGLDRAAALLAAGEIVAIPTETVYGLAADARSGAAVARVYAAKRRPAFNPLIVHVADLQQAAALARLEGEARILAQTFWPGPLTLVLPLRGAAGIASLVTAGLDTVALRVPDLAFAQALLRRTGPLAAPSANPSGRISPTTAAHVVAGVGDRIAAVVDAGPCSVGVESTIIGWRDGAPVLLRPGGLPAEAVEAALGRRLGVAEAGAITAPGQLGSHYAPRVPVRLAARAPVEGETYIGFGPAHPGPLSLSPSGDLVEAAASLFAVLHQADALGFPIAVAPLPDHGLGAAINDRLRRAAAPR